MNKPQYAVELDLGVQWDAGAPMPHVIGNGRQAMVIFELATGPIRTIDELESLDDEVGVVVFDHVHNFMFGGLNDEARKGHPLYGHGLRLYGAHEVMNSEWIAESERRNSVHRYHRGGWHQRYRHYVFCFHDETLECIAAGFTAARHQGGLDDVVLSMTTRLL